MMGMASVAERGWCIDGRYFGGAGLIVEGLLYSTSIYRCITFDVCMS